MNLAHDSIILLRIHRLSNLLYHFHLRHFVLHSRFAKEFLYLMSEILFPIFTSFSGLKGQGCMNQNVFSAAFGNWISLCFAS